MGCGIMPESDRIGFIVDAPITEESAHLRIFIFLRMV